MPSRLLVICAALLLLTACGQKGPLRLPDEPPEQGSSQDSATETTSNQETREP